MNYLRISKINKLIFEDWLNGNLQLEYVKIILMDQLEMIVIGYIVYNYVGVFFKIGILNFKSI